jgi:ABC-type multidrug transport system fused ATPase/permease subunit
MNTLQIIKRIFPIVKPFRSSLIIVFFIIVLITALDLSYNFVLGKIVDSFTLVNSPIFFWIVILIIFLVLQTILERIQTIYEIRNINIELNHHVTNTSLIKTFNLSLGQIKKEHSGFKQSLLTRGRNGITNLLRMCIYDLLPLSVRIILSFVGIILIDSSFLPVLIVFAVIYISLNTYINSKMPKEMKRLSEKAIGIDKNLSDVLRNLFFVKFSNQENKTLSQMKTIQDDHIKDGRKVWTRYSIQTFFASDVLSIFLAVVMIYMLYIKITTGVLSIGSFLPVTAWMFTFMYSLMRLRRIQRQASESVVDIKKMFEMLDQKSDLEEVSNPRNIKVFEDKIIFEQVGFDYLDGKKGALHDINFEIKKGDKVALVGRSGSGKTTIVSLLLRLYDPTHGALLIDGVELKSLVLEDWHNLIAYVPQDSDLLDISIKENILFGAKHHVAEQELEDVLDKAGIKEFIHNLPNGINTIVGERGVKLSGGQKQRVCIARALIKDAPILLLDEATSSLDSETETFVNKAIWEMLGDKTGVVIAHRLSTILDADKIVVMDQGTILGIGTHKELLKSTPYYKMLVDAQNVNL